MGANDGARFAARVSSVLTDAHIKVRTAMLHAEGDHAHTQRNRAMEAMESELGPKLRPIFQEVADDESVSPDMRELFRRVGNPSHQTDFLIEVFSLIGLLFGAGPAAAAGKIQVITKQSMRRWGEVRPDPASAAGLVARGRRPNGTGQDWAKDYGVTAETFAALVDVADRPPSEGDIITLFRRRKISGARAYELLKDTALRDDAIGEVVGLAYAPLDAGTAVAAAVQGHIPQSTMTDLVEQAGIEPRWAQTMYDTAGMPPGNETMLHLWRRGLVSQGDVEQAIRESHTKIKYIPQLIGLRFVIPPMRSVVAMMAKGVVTPQRGSEMLAQLGFTPEVVAGLVQEATVTRHEKSRDLAQGTVLALYEDQHLDRGTALGKLVKLGYDTAEVELLLGLADSRRLARFHNAAISRVHSLYVGHHIDRATASRNLDALVVNADERGQLVALWDLEREANVRRLTEAQYAKAHKMGFMTDAEFVAALLTLGYLETDAKILLRMQPTANPGP